eukprot:20165-Heterococcus_DN1.PRE.2
MTGAGLCKPAMPAKITNSYAKPGSASRAVCVPDGIVPVDCACTSIGHQDALKHDLIAAAQPPMHSSRYEHSAEQRNAAEHISASHV